MVSLIEANYGKNDLLFSILIVLQLTRRKARWDAFTLTLDGKQSVKECSKKFNFGKTQHPFCDGNELKSLCESCKNLIDEIEGEVNYWITGIQKSLLHSISMSTVEVKMKKNMMVSFEHILQR